MTQILADEIARKIWRTGYATRQRGYHYHTGTFTGSIVGYVVGYTRKGKRGRTLTTEFRGEHNFEEAFSAMREHYQGTTLELTLMKVFESAGLVE